MELSRIYNEDCTLGMLNIDDGTVDSIVTSPPYWALRDYGVENCLGAERTPDEYVKRLSDILDGCYRVLKNDGTLWLNIADSYFRNGGKPSSKISSATVGNTKKGIQRGNCKVPDGYKEKSLALVPQRLAIELSNRGWIVRNQIIWRKPNAMPQPVRDRFINDYEVILLLSKSKLYKFNLQRENVNGLERIQRAVWSVNTKASKSGHIAPYPPDLIEPCIKAGTNPGDLVLDPFMGSGTTGAVAIKNGRRFIGYEISREYYDLAKLKLEEVTP